MMRALLIVFLMATLPASAQVFWTDNFDSYSVGNAPYPWASTGSPYVAQIETTSAHSHPKAVGTGVAGFGSGLYRTFTTSYTKNKVGYVDLWFSYCGWGNCSQVYGPNAGSKVLVGYVTYPYTTSFDVLGLAGVQTIEGSSSSVGTMQIVDQNGTLRGSPVTFSLVDWITPSYNWHHFVMNYTLASDSSGHIDFSVDGVSSSYNGPTNTGTTQPVNAVVLQFQMYGCCSIPPYTIAYDDVVVGGAGSGPRGTIGQIIGLRDRAPRLPAALQGAYRRIEPAAFIPDRGKIN